MPHRSTGHTVQCAMRKGWAGGGGQEQSVFLGKQNINIVKIQPGPIWLSCLLRIQPLLFYTFFSSVLPCVGFFSSYLPFHFRVSYVSCTFTCYYLPCSGGGFSVLRRFNSQPLLVALLPRNNLPATLAALLPPTSFCAFQSSILHWTSCHFSLWLWNDDHSSFRSKTLHSTFRDILLGLRDLWRGDRLVVSKSGN